MRIRKKIQCYSTMLARACVCVVQQTITQWSSQRTTNIIFFHICKIIIVLLLQDTSSCQCQVAFFIIFFLTTTRLCASPHIFWWAQMKEKKVKESNGKNCSPFSDSWYSRGNTAISAIISGLGGWCLSFLCCLIVLPKLPLRGRFAMVGTDIFPNSLAMMHCGGSSEDSAVSLILLFTLVNSTLSCEGGWVCYFNCSITLLAK